ncbi:MAG: hypothetical protein ABI599_04455 [Flavobacteriales bacterium]
MNSLHWTKLGVVFAPSSDHAWVKSHAQIPTALVLPDRIRVYFATRPVPGSSATTFLDVDRADPTRLLHVHHEPVLTAGPPGAFDEHGIMPSCVLKHEGRVWLYIGGWSRRHSIPYSNWTGIAVSDDDGITFRRMFPGPVVDRTPHETLSATAVNVLRRGDDWHMWYASGMRWVEHAGRPEEVYRIRYGHSKDGINWTRPNEELVPWQRENEPTHRPTVVERNGVWHMWFCHRGITDFRGGSDAYRLGYARSTDGRFWVRNDAAAGMDVTPGAWDGEMIAYPYVVEVDDRLLMFYNGNGFGASGIGVASLPLSALQ